MKSWSVAIQTKATKQYFPVVLFIMLCKMVLTFEYVDEILKCDLSNESYWAVLCSVVYYARNPKKDTEQYSSVVLFIMKWRFDHRSYDRNLSNCKFKPEKNVWASTGFEPMASVLALQCSTNWAMKTHILGAGQFIEFILTRDRNIEWRFCELRKYKWNEDLTIAVMIAI